MLEANALELDQLGALREKHALMRRVAAAAGVPTLDAQGFLERHHDDGYLWWDFVHLSDFGHRLVARLLLARLSPLVLAGAAPAPPPPGPPAGRL